MLDRRAVSLYTLSCCLFSSGQGERWYVVGVVQGVTVATNDGELRPVRLGLIQEHHDRLRRIAAANRCSMAEYVRKIVIPIILDDPAGDPPVRRRGNSSRKECES